MPNQLNTLVDLRQLRVQLGEGVSGTRDQSRLRVIQKTNEGGLDLLRGLSNHQSILGQQAPNLIDDGGAVFHEERARAMQGLNVGLFYRLDRHTSHGRPAHRFADRFRISTVILVRLDIRPDLSGTHHLDAMTDLLKRSTPIMRTPARLHPNHTG